MTSLLGLVRSIPPAMTLCAVVCLLAVLLLVVPVDILMKMANSPTATMKEVKSAASKMFPLYGLCFPVAPIDASPLLY